MASVEIKDLDDLQKHLRKVSNVNLIYPITKATIVTQAQAKLLAPVDKGGLRSSIHMDVTSGKEVVGRVFTGLYYAPYVEFGTGNRGTGSYPYEHELSFGLKYKSDWAGMKAQPFMFPAMKVGKRELEKELKKALKDVISKK